jgi:UDP-GlcNAc3NAcA epimerase
MKMVTIIGARPQFIKAATVSRVIRTQSEIEEVIVHTGQHYDANMSEIFFTELEIPEPHYNLGIGGQLHGQMTGRQLEAIEEVLIKEKAELVLVYGDTNSTLAGALAAAKLNIPVVHVEAGLRSFNKNMPEEVNRILTDHLAELLFAPTQAAVDNLAEEGLKDQKVSVSGDVMYDAALFYGEKAEAKKALLDKIAVQHESYILVTVHRAENTDDASRLKWIVDQLIKISAYIQVVLPLHPRTRKALIELGLIDSVLKSMIVIEPVGYLEMVLLEKHAKCIVTDSGGVQKEAYFHNRPCITLRNETEWIELIMSGSNRLCEFSGDNLLQMVITEQAKIKTDPTLYGTGNAAEKIVDEIIRHTQKQVQAHNG